MIPKQSLEVIPQNQYNRLICLLNNIYEDWIIYSMNPKNCEYRYKNGIICNRKINIKCDNNKGKFRCYEHISKTVYESKKRNNMDEKLKCIGKTKYGKQLLPCKNLKWKGNDYCKIHFKLPKKVNMNNAFYNYYLKMMQEEKNKILEDEINMLNNIADDIFYYNIYTTIEDDKNFNKNIIRIKSSDNICLEGNYYNRLDIVKNLCRNSNDIEDLIEVVNKQKN